MVHKAQECPKMHAKEVLVAKPEGTFAPRHVEHTLIRSEPERGAIRFGGQNILLGAETPTKIQHIKQFRWLSAWSDSSMGSHEIVHVRDYQALLVQPTRPN